MNTGWWLDTAGYSWQELGLYCRSKQVPVVLHHDCQDLDHLPPLYMARNEGMSMATSCCSVLLKLVEFFQLVCRELPSPPPLSCSNTSQRWFFFGILTCLPPPPPSSHPTMSQRWFFLVVLTHLHHYHLPCVQMQARGGSFQQFWCNSYHHYLPCIQTQAKGDFFSVFWYVSYHYHLPHVQTQAGGGFLPPPPLLHQNTSWKWCVTTTTSLASKCKPKVVFYHHHLSCIKTQAGGGVLPPPPPLHPNASWRWLFSAVSMQLPPPPPPPPPLCPNAIQRWFFWFWCDQPVPYACTLAVYAFLPLLYYCIRRSPLPKKAIGRSRRIYLTPPHTVLSPVCDLYLIWSIWSCVWSNFSAIVDCRIHS